MKSSENETVFYCLPCLPVLRVFLFFSFFLSVRILKNPVVQVHAVRSFFRPSRRSCAWCVSRREAVPHAGRGTHLSGPSAARKIQTERHSTGSLQKLSAVKRFRQSQRETSFPQQNHRTEADKRKDRPTASWSILCSPRRPWRGPHKIPVHGRPSGCCPYIPGGRASVPLWPRHPGGWSARPAGEHCCGG